MDGTLASRQSIIVAIAFRILKKAEPVSNTVFFKHKYLTQPTLTPEDQVIKAIQDLRNVIQRSKNKKGKVNFNAIKALSEILGTN